jgi:hypothetical protein
VRIKNRNRYALSIYAAAAMLAGCTGSPALINTPNTTAIRQALKHHLTFHYTGAEQTFAVPAGVTLIAVDARGAAGGGVPASGQQGGRGGRVIAEIPVAPAENLAIFVGGKPKSPGVGGYNGGGIGLSSTGYSSSYGGGGASDIREDGTALVDRIVVAGGGGGLGGSGVFGYGNYSGGGQGGGNTAGNGQNGSGAKTGGCHTPEGFGGDGGSQRRGGIGGRAGCEGHNGYPGIRGHGGAGGGGSCCAGGGGGGGYYGGGGGGGGTYDDPKTWEGTAGGGGGGSSYVAPSAQRKDSWQGWKDATGNGQIVISW